MINIKILPFALVSLCFSLSWFSLAASDLPLAPEQVVDSPKDDLNVTFDSAQGLVKFYIKKGYTLETVVSTGKVPSYFTQNLPNDLKELPTAVKISTFIRLLLPTIKRVNEQILKVRGRLMVLANQPKVEWSDAENQWLGELFNIYGVASKDIQELLLHVDIIPVSMALAQGIDESGWGSSYFSVEGNNLYGEHLPARGGKFLSTPNGKVKVAAFDSLFQGTASYMHNLNSTRAYRHLWEMRKQLRANDNLSGSELVKALANYSTRGDAYVDNLQALIKYHELDRFDNVDLDKGRNATIYFQRDNNS